jgi:hypothetical protein
MNGRTGRSMAGFVNRCVVTIGVALGVAFMRLAAAAPVVIQDGEDAIYVDPTRLTAGPGQRWKKILKELPLEVGAEIEVTGFVDPGGYAPRIVMQSVRRVGRQPSAPAVRALGGRSLGRGSGERVRNRGGLPGRRAFPDLAFGPHPPGSCPGAWIGAYNR